jgi:hypothetical protein
VDLAVAAVVAVLVLGEVILALVVKVVHTEVTEVKGAVVEVQEEVVEQVLEVLYLITPEMSHVQIAPSLLMKQ